MFLKQFFVKDENLDSFQPEELNRIKSFTVKNKLLRVNSGFIFIQHRMRDANYEEHSARYNVIINSYRYQRQFPVCIAILFFKHECSQAEAKISWWVND